jgi:hypothetical protein
VGFSLPDAPDYEEIPEEARVRWTSKFCR